MGAKFAYLLLASKKTFVFDPRQSELSSEKTLEEHSLLLEKIEWAKGS